MRGMLSTRARKTIAALGPGVGRSAIAAVVVLLALASARTALGVTQGLHADYFAAGDHSGPPDVSEVDPAISTTEVSRSWIHAPPPLFAARWRGYVVVGEADFYSFAVTSRARTTVTVDGLPIVNKGQTFEPGFASGRIRLTRGSHPMVVELFEASGSAPVLDLTWAPTGAASLKPVPRWALSTARIPYWKAVAARLLDALIAVAAAVASALAVRFVVKHHSGWIRANLQRRPGLAALALFAGLAVLQTWPLAASPAQLSRNDNADTMLNEWALAWVAHQAVRDPLHLFDANIFYPERNTLAYTESLILQSALAAPVLWLGGTAVLAYNLVLLAGLALSGWAMSLVVARWTGDWLAGVTAGAAFAFNAHVLARLPHLQAQHVEFLPFMLLALDALLRDPRARHTLGLATAFTLQSLTSGHLMVFCLVALVAATLSRPEDWRGPRGARVALNLAIAGVLSAMVLLPFLLPYWRIYDEGMFRPLASVAAATTWRDYLSTPGQLHFDVWSHRFYTGNALFPGATALALAAFAVVRGIAWRDRRARMCLAFGVAGFLLSFGTALPGYAALYEALPVLKGIRVVSRFGYLAVAAVAVLAGFGLAELRRTAIRPWRRAASMAAFALIVAEPLAIPKRYARVDEVSPVYEQLAQERDAIVAELPMYPSQAIFLNASYMLNSTVHWKPLLNGYTGFVPASYNAHLELAAAFPSPSSIAALRRVGVTHVVVHRTLIGAPVFDMAARSPDLHLIGSDGGVALYRLGRSR